MIYFIQAGDNGPVKIGFAANVRKRLRDLQCSSPYPLKLLCALDGEQEREAELHAQFHGLKMRGEWFTPDNGLLDFARQYAPSPSTMTFERQFTIGEVADIIKMSQRTIRRWIKSGRLRAIAMPGRGATSTEYRIPQSAIIELGFNVEGNTTPPKDEADE